jgi:membrane protein
MSVKTAHHRPRRKPQPGAVRDTHHHLSLWGPLRGLGLWRVFTHLIREMGRTNVSLLASAIAFYGLLATFPALVVIITSFALMADPGYVQWLMSGLHGIMPEEAWKLIADELQSLVTAPNRQIGLGLLVSLAIALWSAHSASASIMEALNRIYRTQEERSVLLYHSIAMAFTLGGLCFGLMALATVAGVPALLSWLPLSSDAAWLFSFIRWPILVPFAMVGLVVLYRFGPYRKHALWTRTFVGAAAATLLVLLGSALFSVYVARFGSYDKTYGSIGAVIVLLMWFYVSAYATLLGALLDAEMSRRAAFHH